MASSQNGWPVIPNTGEGRSKLTELILPGNMPHAVRVLSGDVAVIARWHVKEYHRRVEPIKPRGCWGWNVRKIGSGNTWSNHASATAWDLNAPDNPDGASPSEVMTSRQINECHKLESESHNVLRWGADWGDPDPMHWEIVGSRAQVREFAAGLVPQGVYNMAVKLNGFALPELKEGDDDDRMAGYNYVYRAQFMLNFAVDAGLKVDGVYGEKTSAAVKALASTGNGKSIGLAEWAQLYGLRKG